MMLPTSDRRDRQLADQFQAVLIGPARAGKALAWCGLPARRDAGRGCAGGYCRCDGRAVQLCERHHATLTGAEDPPGVVLTCCDCDTTYEPSGEDIAAGRVGCPDPDCGGWVFSSALTEPGTAGGTR